METECEMSPVNVLEIFVCFASFRPLSDKVYNLKLFRPIHVYNYSQIAHAVQHATRGLILNCPLPATNFCIKNLLLKKDTVTGLLVLI